MLQHAHACASQTEQQTDCYNNKEWWGSLSEHDKHHAQSMTNNINNNIHRAHDTREAKNVVVPTCLLENNEIVQDKHTGDMIVE